MAAFEDRQTATVGTGTWEIDAAHTLAEFSVRHMMIATVRGRFGRVRGALELNEEDPASSSIALEIDAATIATGDDKRDAHLKSADFFDVENYPTIRFRSRAIRAVGDARYAVTGDLTMRGVTREVVVQVQDEGRAKSPWGQQAAGFTADARIDRRDFGLEWNQALETGGVLVSNEVKIHFEVEVVRKD